MAELPQINMDELPKLPLEFDETPEKPKKTKSKTKPKTITKKILIKELLNNPIFPILIDNQPFTNIFIFSYLSVLGYPKEAFKEIFLNLDGLIGAGFLRNEDRIAAIFVFKCIREIMNGNENIDLQSLLNSSLEVGRNVFNIELPNGEIHNIHPDGASKIHDIDINTLKIDKIINVIFRLLTFGNIEEELLYMLVELLQIQTDSTYLNSLFKSINPDFPNVDEVIPREEIEAKGQERQRQHQIHLEESERERELREQRRPQLCKMCQKNYTGFQDNGITPYEYCDDCSEIIKREETIDNLIIRKEQKLDKLQNLSKERITILVNLEQKLKQFNERLELTPLIDNLTFFNDDYVETKSKEINKRFPPNLKKKLAAITNPNKKIKLLNDFLDLFSTQSKKLKELNNPHRSILKSTFYKNIESLKIFKKNIVYYLGKFEEISTAPNFTDVLKIFSQTLPTNMEQLDIYNTNVNEYKNYDLIHKIDNKIKADDKRAKKMLKQLSSKDKKYVDSSFKSYRKNLTPISLKLLDVYLSIEFNKEKFQVTNIDELNENVVNPIITILQRRPFYLLDKEILIANSQVEHVANTVANGNVAVNPITNIPNPINLFSNQESNANATPVVPKELDNWEDWVDSNENGSANQPTVNKSRTRSRSSLSSNRTKKNTPSAVATSTKPKQSKKGKGKGNGKGNVKSKRK